MLDDDELRRHGKISPSQVQPQLAKIAAPDHLSVVGSRNASSDKSEGSSYGIWIGRTACVTGGINKGRVWAEANGHYLESGCLAPPSTH